MTRKTRPTKKPPAELGKSKTKAAGAKTGTKAAGAKTGETKAGEAKAGEVARKTTEGQRDPQDTSTGKVTLPAFGLAEDVLQKAPDAGGDKAAIRPDDPRRIFAFADSLEKGSVETEARAAPRRIETWVAFSLAGEVFALPVSPIREVVRVTSITRVPHAPKPIRGVTNMRGRVIPVIDLRLRIELPETQLARSSRVIVVSSRGRLLGLLVDAVHQVIHIDRDQVQPPPEDVVTVQADYLSGVYHLDDQLILLLDIDRALIIQEGQHPSAGAPPTADRESGDTATGSA